LNSAAASQGRKKEKGKGGALPLNDKSKIPGLGVQGKPSSEKNNSLEKFAPERFQRRRGLSAGQNFFCAESPETQP
jgi:hypothetical protein